MRLSVESNYATVISALFGWHKLSPHFLNQWGAKSNMTRLTWTWVLSRSFVVCAVSSDWLIVVPHCNLLSFPMVVVLNGVKVRFFKVGTRKSRIQLFPRVKNNAMILSEWLKIGSNPGVIAKVFCCCCENTSLVLWRKSDNRKNDEWIVWLLNVGFIGKLVVLKFFDCFTVVLYIWWGEELAGTGFRTIVAIVIENTSRVTLDSCNVHANVIKTSCVIESYSQPVRPVLS